MQIYVSKDGQQYGPYTVEQLRQYVQQGNFTSADHACYDGQNWATVGQVPGFAAGGDSMTTPQQPQAVQQQAMSTVSGSKRKKIVLWSSIGGIAALLVAGLLIWLLGGGDQTVQDAQEKEAQAEASSESNQTTAETPDAKTAEVAKIDLDDNETRNRIIAEAIDGKNIPSDYTGWSKKMHYNGQISSVGQWKDGKMDGPQTMWYRLGNGQKQWEGTYKDGAPVTIVVWKPNGEKCPDTNVVNGNGVWVHYNEDGTESFRVTFKDGEPVLD